MNTVSIIIPVYNGEKFLSDCLNDLIIQTYPEIEILVVDNGSTDRSLSIAREFSAKDQRIRCFIQKKSGVSAARNMGIRFSTGDYISFVDVDDRVDRSFIEELVHAIQGVDLSVCSVQRIYPDGKVEDKWDGKEMTISGDEAIKSALRIGEMEGYLCNKMFLRSTIIDKQIALDEEISIGEDLLFCIQYLLHCKRVRITNKTTYNYFQYIESAKNTSRTATVFQEKWVSELVALDKIVCLLESNPSARRIAEAKKAIACGFYLKRMRRCNYKNKGIEKELLHELRKNYYKSVFNRVTTIKGVLSSGLCAVSPSLEYRVYSLLQKTKTYSII